MHSACVTDLYDGLMPAYLLGLADHLIAEDDLDLTLGRRPGDGLEAGLDRIVGVADSNVALELLHAEEHRPDRERPCEKHKQQEHLIAGHPAKCGTQ